MQARKRRVLMEEGIVSPETYCASFPLQITLKQNTASSTPNYQHQFPIKFFDSPWPLEFNPRPLHCQANAATGTFTYYSSNLAGRPQTPAFTLQPSDDVAPPDFVGGQRTFDYVTEIQGHAFRVVQSILPPLTTPDMITPVLTGGENMPTAKNLQPSFVYNAQLGMMELSPPVFRALALYFLSENGELANQPGFSPYLYASFLVVLPPTGPYGYPYYCLLQFLEAPPPFCTRLHKTWNHDMNIAVPPLTCAFLPELLEAQSTRPPYFLPHPIFLPELFLQQQSYEIIAFDSYSYGVMGIPLASVCHTSPTRGRVQLLRNNKTIKHFLGLGVLRNQHAQPTTILPVFSRIWCGELSAWPQQTTKKMQMLIVPRWNNLDAMLANIKCNSHFMDFDVLIQHLPNILSADQADLIRSQLYEVRYQQNSETACLIPKPLLEDTETLTTTDSLVAACQGKNACSSIQPDAFNFVSNFEQARNLFKIRQYKTLEQQPKIVLFSVESLFAALGSSSAMLQALLPELSNPPPFYSQLVDSLCWIRMQADMIHFEFARETSNSDQGGSTLRRFKNYTFSKATCEDIVHFAMIVDVCVRGAIHMRYCLDHVVDGTSALARQMHKYLGGVFCINMCDLAKQMLLAVRAMDARQSNQNHATGIAAGNPSSKNANAFAREIYLASTQVHGTDFLETVFGKDDEEDKELDEEEEEQADLWTGLDIDHDNRDGHWIPPILPFVEQGVGRNYLVACVYSIYLLACWWKRTNQKNGNSSSQQQPLFSSKDILQQEKQKTCLHHMRVMCDKMCDFLVTNILQTNYQDWKKSILGTGMVYLKERQDVETAWQSMLQANVSDMGNFADTFAGAQNPLMWRHLSHTNSRPYLLLETIMRNEYPAMVLQDIEIPLTQHPNTTIQLVTDADERAQHPLHFHAAQKLGAGSYGSVFSGQLSYTQENGTPKSIPAAMKIQNIRNVMPSWDEDLRALFVAPHVMEVIAMNMLHRYGRWEGDPYILSPVFFWTGSVSVPVQVPPSSVDFETSSVDSEFGSLPVFGTEELFVIFMESFRSSQFITLDTWSRSALIPTTSKDIIFRRLNRYYEYMAYESPVKMQMQDNKLNNILIENNTTTNPQVLMIVHIDQAMSMVNVPLEDFIFVTSSHRPENDEEEEEQAFLKGLEDHVLKEFVRDKSITFFDNTYQQHNLIPSTSMMNNRLFSKLESMPSEEDAYHITRKLFSVDD